MTALGPDTALDQMTAAAEAPAGRRRPGSRLARNTAIFSIATGLSRIAGLAREVLASSMFGTSGQISAFTLAFAVPNLVRQLAADTAISAAFVPVFTELLEKGRRREAFRLASTLFFLIVLVLGAITAAFIALAPVLMPLLIGDQFTPELDALTVHLSQLLFPIVILLGLTGLTVGILNSYEHFTVPAFAPLLWNIVIMGVLVGLGPLFEDEIDAYAIGVLAGTAAQFLITLPVLKRLDFRLELAFDLRDPRLRQVLRLMLPVTIGLGVINFDLLINSVLGSLVSTAAPRAIDAAFRIYMLPQGVFSVALATVLFPTLSRYAARKDMAGLRRTAATGVRQNFLLLIPAAALTLVLAEPITRVVYERGEFGPDSTAIVSEALFWFAFSLPFAGVNLLLTRTFFSVQKPWAPTVLAVANLVVNAAVSLALYAPLGVAGIVLGTVVANAGMTVGQWLLLRRRLDGLEARRTVVTTLQIVAGSIVLGAVAYGAWAGLDALLGDGFWGQIVAVGVACALGIAVYAAAVGVMGVREAHQIWRLVAGRLGRGGAGAGGA